MWFKRKSRNRRLGREFVLDVKLRSSQVRASRARMAAVALGVVFATVLGVCLVVRGGQWALNQLVYENNAFSIQVIDIQTDGVLAVDEIRRWTGVRPGANLLALDLERVKRDLGMVSLIESVSVERIPPHTLRVRVVEREPIAQVNVPRPKPGGGIEMSVLHLDSQGWVMAPLDPQLQEKTSALPPEPLPTILLTGTDIQVGRRLALPSVQAALQLLVAFDQSSLHAAVEITRIDASSAEVLTVTTGQGSEVVLGLTNFDQQLRRWQVIQDAGQRLGKAISAIDLAVSNNIPARWLEASALPLAAPKAVKPLRNRKKHV
ncbi:MAG TPA: FtsQ-type POTRA domain-containing protein [Verrucomicrobiae bacterium]